MLGHGYTVSFFKTALNTSWLGFRVWGLGHGYAQNPGYLNPQASHGLQPLHSEPQQLATTILTGTAVAAA